MKLDDLKLILIRLGVPEHFLIPTRPQQLLIPCPLSKWLHKTGKDSRPSCSVRFDDPHQPTLYNCFACKSRGKLWDLVHSFGEFAGDLEITMLGIRLIESDEPTLASRLDHATKGFDEWVYKREEGKLRILNESALDSYPKAWNVASSRRYLEGRRVTEAISDFWDLRWHAAHSRVVFPVRTREGQLVGGVGRAIFPDTVPPYYNLFGFEAGATLGGVHKATGKGKIAVCEGYFDLMNVWWWGQQAGYDVVCTFTANTTQEQAKLLQQMDASILYLYDNDDAGERGWLNARELLSPVVFGLRRGKVVGKDVGELVDESQFKECLT